MEANLHLDSNVLLPPRKRLLAGLKKQNSDESHRFPSDSDSGSDTQIHECVRSFLINPNLSDEEIVEASMSALATAVKLAKDKRVEAEEKAEIAAKAIAAAKDALELSALISEESRRLIRCTKKKKKKKKNVSNKIKKKQVPVKTLYNKHHLNTDEELARKLHKAINSSPRIKLGEETKAITSYQPPSKTQPKLLMDKPYYSSDETCSSSKKRSKTKHKDDMISSSNSNGKKPITSLWKCNAFNTSVCGKQDKAVESS